MFSGKRGSLGTWMRPGPPEPDPKNFKIERLEGHGDFLLAYVVYPDCTSFEGRKILIFGKEALPTLRITTELDPHFIETGLPLIARFRPTEEGLRMALDFCRMVRA